MPEGILSDIPAQKRARKRKETEIRQRKDDLRALMDMPSFRRFMWWLIDDVCAVWSDTFDLDARVDARNAGRRSVGVGLLLECQRLTPRAYSEMVLDAAREPAQETEDDNVGDDAED